jgi:osmoprotectant transport system substrate-binding protein
MNTMLVRRLALALVVPRALLAAGCGSDDGDKKSEGKDLGAVTIVAQKFPEADIMAELYRGLLEDAGFDASVKALGGRDLYLEPLEKGTVQVSTDYLSSMTEALNRQANGDDADLVASHDPGATLTALNKLAGPVGLTALKPAEAQDANGFAVTKKFAEENDLTTLSDLAALGKTL